MMPMERVRDDVVGCYAVEDEPKREELIVLTQQQDVRFHNKEFLFR